MRRLCIGLSAAAMTLCLASCAGVAAPVETPSTDPVQAYVVEWQGFMVSCMAEAGFEVTTSDDGGVGTDFIPTEQIDPYTEARSACMAQAPVMPALEEGLARDQYRQQVATAECLRGEGIDTGDVPSESQRVEQILAGDPVWTAYGAVSEDSFVDIPDLLETCPQPGS